jgi:ABC-type multidrug transport system fused ATPase/permease subunit
VFAVYAFGTLSDERYFQSWRFRRRSWAARFAFALCQLAPSEAETWRTVTAAGWTAQPSSRLFTVLKVAEDLARTRDSATLDVEDVLRALLLCALQWPSEEAANVWLLAQLRKDALATLQVPSATPQLAAVINGHARGGEPPPPRSREAAAWLRDAQLWALCWPSNEMALRHVVAALVAPRGPAKGKRMLRSAGGEPRQLAPAFAELIRREVPHEDHATWQWLLANDAPPRASYKPGYANDIARGVDALSIGGDVHALAAVLASVETRPPLSVGLFGNWGSGKSFFMTKLREHIQVLAKKSCGVKQTAYCAEIAQIEFNAWHYIDGDLWASLVSHVLDSLEGYFRGDAQSVAEQRKVELATTQLRRAEIEREQHQLDERRQKLEADITAFRPSAGQMVQGIEGEVADELKDRTAEAHVEVRKALDDVARQLGIPPGELTLSKAREHATALRAWWSRRSLRSLIIGGAILAAAAGATAIAVKLHLSLVAIAAAIAPAVVVVERILKIGLPIARAARRADALGQKVTDKLARTAPENFREQQAIESKQTELTAERQRLDARADELRTLLDTSKKPGMRDYVLERVTQYRNRLGIIASVHRDFQNLSDQLRDDTTEPKLQRIILYIDDLDRCPPKRVVEMLQAIHLLLSFELFVVVVAVDPKWLLRSLEAYYARQFAGCTAIPDDREARPQFYLEKIFQIPYALRPMNATRFGSMVGSLLGSAVHDGAAPPPASGGAATASATDAAAAQPAAAYPAASAPADPAAAAEPSGAASDDAVVDLMPRNLEITQAELAHLQLLGLLVASPRAAKRLTNLYRIVRAGLSGDELDEFIDDRYQVTQIVLAAVVGCPDIAVPWFKQIFARREGDTAALLAPLEAMAPTSPRASALLQRLRACGELASWQHALEVCSLAARYSFETGALLELLPG